MTPTKDIVPGVRIPADELIVYAEDQPEYIPLPMWKGEDGLRVSRWQLTWRERLRVAFNGSIWLSVLTFNKPLQPVKIETTCPLSRTY